MYQTLPGTPLPFGATATTNGVNFAIFAPGDVRVELRLADPQTLQIIGTWDLAYSTGQVKHIFLEGVALPVAYAYRIHAPSICFLHLLDPYAKCLTSSNNWDAKETYCPFGVVLKQESFDWQGDRSPLLAHEDLIIYEMHVRGFTKDSSSQTVHPGTYRGVIEKIPYLRELGITAVELMPIHEFYEKEYSFQGLHQYWGYSTVNFFSPMNRYCSEQSHGSSLIEFKEMVRALHKAGIEVILDVVFNHTAEGNERGPILSFKGLANHLYYIFNSQGEYANYSGCGNTFNCNTPVVIEFILESLRYWVVEMHIDGFRFDLASIMYRAEDGSVLPVPPLLQAISQDPILANTKLIAEPWDSVGLYQVGSFFPESQRWGEWNGRYRDCVRRFLKGDKGLKGDFATRISGSEDLYGYSRRYPRNSINFITSHDGFSLHDLCSYNKKYNEANQEGNLDGLNHNDSWNCGYEGTTVDPTILELRAKQMRNFHLALMVSQGIPLIYMGDEYGHTKNGNNNTWCQDNILSWFRWDLLEENRAFFRFYQGLIHFRRANPLLRHTHFLHDENIEWHGQLSCDPHWELEDHLVAYTLLDRFSGEDLYIAFNASSEAVEITLPPRKQGFIWRWIANTALPPPDDFHQEGEGAVAPTSYEMPAYSSILLKTFTG